MLPEKFKAIESAVRAKPTEISINNAYFWHNDHDPESVTYTDMAVRLAELSGASSVKIIDVALRL